VSIALPLALATLLAPSPNPSSPGYRVARTQAPREALLSAEDEAWAPAQAIKWGPAAYETRFRALSDEAGLVLRFDATDPSPWHTMTKHDDHLWEEEVVEIFLDLNRSGHDYAEIEISPGNVVCDVRMVSPWPHKQMDLAWDLSGLETRVRMTKDATGRTIGWTATAVLPWAGFRSLPSSTSITLPPKPGDSWRFNVFRVKRPGGPSAPQKGAVEAAWSKPPVESFHVPEAFRDFVFDTAR
jgi:hypothetical protein